MVWEHNEAENRVGLLKARSKLVAIEVLFRTGFPAHRTKKAKPGIDKPTSTYEYMGTKEESCEIVLLVRLSLNVPHLSDSQRSSRSQAAWLQLDTYAS